MVFIPVIYEMSQYSDPKMFGLDEKWHSTMSTFEKYKEYIQSEPVG
jgi:hypothetical protein